MREQFWGERTSFERVKLPSLCIYAPWGPISAILCVADGGIGSTAAPALAATAGFRNRTRDWRAASRERSCASAELIVSNGIDV